LLTKALTCQWLSSCTHDSNRKCMGVCTEQYIKTVRNETSRFINEKKHVNITHYFCAVFINWSITILCINDHYASVEFVNHIICLSWSFLWLPLVGKFYFKITTVRAAHIVTQHKPVDRVTWTKWQMMSCLSLALGCILLLITTEKKCSQVLPCIVQRCTMAYNIVPITYTWLCPNKWSLTVNVTCLRDRVSWAASLWLTVNPWHLLCNILLWFWCVLLLMLLSSLLTSVKKGMMLLTASDTHIVTHMCMW
jgi:hypothetical protein